MKRLTVLLMAVCLILSMSAAAFAADADALAAADRLNALGLFNGMGTDANGKPIYALEQVPTREQAITMLVRILGKEAEALAGTWEIPFTDVADWAKPYVGYAYNNKLTNGISATEFGGSSTVTATQYLTFVLRALGYDSSADFKWNAAWELSDKLGITSGEYNAETTEFLRGDVTIVSNSALDIPLKGSDDTLLQTLQNSGAVPVLLTDVESRGHNLTSGKPEGEAKTVRFTFDNRLPAADEGYIYGYSIQPLDNGYTRIGIEYVMPEGMDIYLCDYPNHNIFSFWTDWKTSNKRSVVQFDLSNKDFAKVKTILCVFNNGPEGQYHGQYIYIHEEQTVEIIGVSDGKPVGAAEAINYSVLNEFTQDIGIIHSYTKQPLDNDRTRFVLEYTMPAGLKTIVFNSPDSDKIEIRDDRATPQTKNKLIFDIKNAALAEIELLTVSFYSSDDKRFLISTDMEAAQIYLTDGKPVGEAKAMEASVRDELAAGTGTLHSLMMQPLDNGYTRFSVDYTLPAGKYIAVFDAPNADNISGRMPSTTNGARSNLVFDVKNSALAASANMTIQFYTSDNDRFFVILNLKSPSQEAPNQAPKSLVTEGKPAGAAQAVDYFTKDSLSAGAGNINSLTMQPLDNGYTRFAVDYSLPSSMNLSVFDSPDGEKISIRKSNIESSGSLVFDVENSALSVTELLVIKFSISDGERFAAMINFGEKQ